MAPRYSTPILNKEGYRRLFNKRIIFNRSTFNMEKDNISLSSDPHVCFSKMHDIRSTENYQELNAIKFTIAGRQLP